MMYAAVATWITLSLPLIRVAIRDWSDDRKRHPLPAMILGLLLIPIISPPIVIYKFVTYRR